MSVFHENMLIGASGQGAAGPTAGRSVRFNSADSAYLSRVFPSIATNQKVTFSAWVKRSKLGTDQSLLSTNRNNTTNIDFIASNALRIYTGDGAGTGSFDWTTTQLFRDVSAWYHIVVAWDTTQATATNRLKVYVNGQEVASWSSQGTITQNMQLGFSSATPLIGNGIASGYGDFYLALVHFIDGQALTPSSFGETSATTGRWEAKTYAGTYGTNGFFLDFLDNSTAAALGYDAAGSNDWTVNNIQAALPNNSVTLPASNAPSSVEYLVVGGGGGGGSSYAGGGGAGGFRTGTLSVTAGSTYSVQVGVGGTGATVANSNGTNGTDSIFSSITSIGGGGGGGAGGGTAGSGGSGGGSVAQAAGTGTSGQGNNGATGSGSGTGGGGGGGGAGAAGTAGAASVGGAGGAGSSSSITGTSVTYAGGGGGGTEGSSNGAGGSGGGGAGGTGSVKGGDGTANRGGGGGGGGGAAAPARNGGNGGSGIVVIRYANTYADLTIGGGLTYTSTNTGGYKIYTITASSTDTAAGVDSLRDHPTSTGSSTGLGGEVAGNYCTWNPLDKNASLSPANGNLDITGVSSAHRMIRGTIGVTSGKWYWEITASNAGGSPFVGIAKQDASLANGQYVGANATSWGYASYLGQKYNNGSASSYGAGYTTGDVIGVALDADNGTLTFYKNNTSQGTAFTGLTSGPYFPAVSVYDANDTFVLNAGQRAFAYTAPSGFSPLVDTLLPTPTIAKPNTVMDVALYTGNASSRSITGINFSPDFVWTKCRSTARAHTIVDIVRGATNELYPNLTSAAGDDGSGLTAFNSDGYSLGNSTTYNANGDTYVSWLFDAGSSNATNTSGTITSTVRANISAGFSVVTWTGNGSPGTLGHGLGVAPQMIIIKNRSASSNWIVGHQYINSSPWNNWCLILNSTGAVSGAVAAWGGIGGFAPTSSLFGVGIDTNNNGNNFVAYCWAPVTNYSAFGSYTGNGSTDGPFVYTGFRPRWVMVKNASAADSWSIIDTARNTSNLANSYLLADSSGAEATPGYFRDYLSNGFKIRDNGSGVNTNGNTYVWAAFAEAPFPYARAR